MMLFRWTAAFAFLPAAAAATITLTPTSFGFYRDTGTASAGNHAIGWYSSADQELRQYLIFDRSSVSGTITAATLVLEDPQTGYSSPDPQETWQIFDVSVPLAGLSGGTGGLTAYQDLGTGTILGSLVVSPANTHQVISMSLNADGLAYLNAQSTTFGIGGALVTLARNTSVTERLFNNGSTVNLVRELQLTYGESAADSAAIPEPATFLLLSSGLFLLSCLRRGAGSN